VHHSGGQWIETAAPLHRLPLFVRGGALVPTTDSTHDTMRTEEPTRALLWFPTTESQTQVALYEDDGLQNGGTADRCVVHRFAATARTAKLRLEMDSSSSWPLPYKRIRVVLPADEKRKPELVGAMLVA
jgi:alpha-glucosidase (family GH31 glycosyl hydrolase)